MHYKVNKREISVDLNGYDAEAQAKVMLELQGVKGVSIVSSFTDESGGLVVVHRKPGTSKKKLRKGVHKVMKEFTKAHE